MTRWYKIDLGDAMLASTALDELAHELTRLVGLERNLPLTLSAFYAHESQGLHCHVMVYLTEDFTEIANLNAPMSVCGVPPEGASWLAGEPRV